MSNAKTEGKGGGGKCVVYYSQKYKRKVIEKRVNPDFLKNKRSSLTTLINDYIVKEDMLKKESIMMMMTKIAKLDCCVEILEFGINPFRIIMEYCEGGDLRKILDNYEVPILDKTAMISQILIAIKKIHDFGVIHGDLKCANIFLANKYIPGNGKNIKIKIGDFGLSEIEGGLIYGGTYGFMAPEIKTIGGSFESDIYSIGKVMLEIMTQLPVLKISAITIDTLYTLKDKLPKFLNVSEFYNVVEPCLYENPRKRPNADALFNRFHELVAYWVVCEKINDKMLADYRIGDTIPVDCHKHALTLSDDKMRQYNGSKWYCSICNNKDNCFLSNTLSFHCRICQYDLCQKCISNHNYRTINNLMLKHVPPGKKVYVINHEHPLLLSSKEERNYPPDSVWFCDICKVRSSDYVYSLHCKKCGYDVCLKCYKENFKIVQEKNCCCIIF